MLFLTQLTDYGIILPVYGRFFFSLQQHNTQKLTILRICVSGVAENILNCDKSRKNKPNRKDKDLKAYKTLGIKAVQGSLRSANQKGIRGILKSFYHPNIQSRVAVAVLISSDSTWSYFSCWILSSYSQLFVHSVTFKNLFKAKSLLKNGYL